MKRLLLALAALTMSLAALPAGAQTSYRSGDLIKSDAASAVYYFAADGKRYVFPTERTYFTWYSDFSGVKTLTTGELASIPLGGNITYKPGSRMLKIVSDPTVYAVSKNGILRAIGSEAVASALYGSAWNKQIDDLPDSFFVNYRIGAPIADASGYDKASLMTGVPTINIDKLFEAPPAGFVDVRQNSGFFPKDMTLAPGTKVTWIALDGSQPRVASDADSTSGGLQDLDSGTLGAGETYSYAFTESGIWGYSNQNASSQTGTITIQ